MITVSALTIYPIKGCRGIAVTTATITDIGLADDRRFMVVDSNGRFLSQREQPRMALIAVSAAGSGWRLSAPDMPPIEFVPTQSGPVHDVVIWRDTVPAIAQSATVHAWLSRYLGIPCTLVSMPTDHRRLVSADYARTTTDAVSFADGYASLLANTASLDDLNQRLTQPVGMDRFRPNIVVSGAEAWQEDEWHHLQIGGCHMYAVKPCARCVVTTTDQDTAQRHQEPLRTLATFRTQPLGVIFGQNIIHDTTGTIAVGDTVIVPALHGRT